MAATSIHVVPIKNGSEQHNNRDRELKYVKTELSHLNESWSIASVSDVLEDIKTRYTGTTGQKMQKGATPIREGVIVVSPTTTMEQLKSFANQCEEEFGIKAFQIHIHKDEGHTPKNTDVWKENLHAHIVFDWTQKNGKSVKMKAHDMVRMQTILADSLGMERGVKSDVQHLNAIQFKVQAEEKRLKALQIGNEALQKESKTLQDEISDFKASKSTKEVFTGIVSRITKKTEADALKIENEALKTSNTNLTKQVQELKVQNYAMNNAGLELQKQVKILEDKNRNNSTSDIVHAAKYNSSKETVANINRFLKSQNLRQIDYRGGNVFFQAAPGQNKNLER